MSAVVVVSTAPAPAPDTRQRLVDAAIALFIRHSFAGTSLQMIADELGLTKAAIYHHFRTREQLLTAILEPIIDKLSAVVDDAEEQRGVNARAERMLNGYARLAVENPMLVSVLASDPSVHTVLKTNREWTHMISRQMTLLADVHPGTEGFMRAQFVFAGIAGSADPKRDVDDEWLHRQLVETGRRALGLRTPRRHS
jgi:AcrR family transcriptional regulator